MKVVVVILFSLIAGNSFGQNYNVALIPDSLKQNASLVKRNEEKRIEQKSAGRAKYYTRYAYTIFNEEGLSDARLVEYYDKFTDITHIEGKLYNGEGKIIRTVKKKEINDVSGGGDNLMDDTRFKVHNFNFFEYPFTVEYEVEKETDGLLGLPHWLPIEKSGVAVENSKLIVISDASSPIRFKQRNFSKQPIIKEESGKKIVQWEYNNAKVINPEALMPVWIDIAPSVMLAPSNFKASNYAGNMSTWTDYGKYIYELLKGRDVLHEKTKEEIRNLTSGMKTVAEKIEAVYSYMQKNTRYISVQLGIGGWQPFEASYVAEKKYGDCKALSNYTIALLKEAGIIAKYVEIKSGNSEPLLHEDFPSSQFNHVVACVPLDRDTVWLECTDPTRSMGYMGSSTGNRKAILIDESGGHVVNTPHYSSKDNSQIRKVSATVDASGNVSAEMRTIYSGIAQEDVHGLIHQATKEEREKYLNSTLGLPTYSIEASDYNEKKGRIPSVEEYLKIAAPNYATITGKRLFIQPNIFSKNYTKLSTDKPRKYPIEYTSSFMDIDTAIINIPEGYQPEAMPKDVSLINKFGKYSISFKLDGSKIFVYRHYQRESATYPASDYVELAKFYDDMYKADRSKFVLVKKE